VKDRGGREDGEERRGRIGWRREKEEERRSKIGGVRENEEERRGKTKSNQIKII
jgi:hypothetical protein